MYESRRGLAAGIVVAALGLLCLGGGIALLGWRLLEPDKAVIVPPGHTNAPVLTPTPGLLGTPVIPPALPDDPVGLVILPVSERTTLTPTPASRITVFRATVFRATVSRATITPSQILTAARSPIYTATVTGTPTGTLTNTPTRTLTHTSTPRPGPVNPTGTVGTAEPVTESPPSRTPTTTLTITFTPMQTPTYTPWPSPVPVVPERLVIDAIGLDVPVIPVGQHTVTLEGVIYSQWNVPDNGAAGWHQDSARLGESGNLVLNGHHNTNGEVFRYLVALHPGDLIRLAGSGQRYVYMVAQTMTLAEQYQPVEVRQANARWILPTDDRRVTLVTCWPYESNSHRLIVIALPLPALGFSAELP